MPSLFLVLFCGAILTMFRCHGRAQKSLEHTIASLISGIDREKQKEFRAFIKKLHERMPPTPKQQAKVPFDKSVVNFDKVLELLASADVVANVKATIEDLFVIEEFVGGAATVVRAHGAELQKKNNFKAYDYRATAAFHLFNAGKLLVALPDSSGFSSRMVNFLGDAYYQTRWCVGKVRRSSFRRNFVVVFSRSLSVFCRHLCRRCRSCSTAKARSRTWNWLTARCAAACTTGFPSRSTSSWDSTKTAPCGALSDRATSVRTRRERKDSRSQNRSLDDHIRSGPV